MNGGKSRRRGVAGCKAPEGAAKNGVRAGRLSLLLNLEIY